MFKRRFAVIAQAVVLSACFVQSAQAQRFAQPPGTNFQEPLAEVQQSRPGAIDRSVDTGAPNPSTLLHVTVSLPYGDPEGIQAYVDQVSNPKSPNYRHYLTPQQVGDRFGLPYARVQDVASYLQSKGFSVDLVAKNHLSVSATGTIAAAERAFHTTVRNFHAMYAEAGNRDFFAPAGAVKLPQSVAPYVQNVTGLENFTKPQFRQVLDPNQTRVLYNSAPAYNGGMHGEGRTIAISNWDGFRLSNVPLYYSQYGLAAPSGGVGSNITVKSISGGAGSGNPGAEGDLDIQMVLGQAPLCNFIVYDGGASDLIGVLTQEVNDNLADVISESYGWNIPAATATSAHNLHLSMSAQGITYMAASGDSGTTLEPYSYPDYDPEVLMVGGSIATTNTSGVRTSEVGWGSGGSGWSTNSVSFNKLPSYQHGNGVPTNINFRLVPDVALHASGGSTGAYYFYFNGALTSGYVGTSFACPVFAGALGVAEQKIIAQGGLPADANGKRRFGRIQDLIYSQNGRSDVWFDITSGNSGTLPNGSTANAGPGWDFNTGWGAINFDAFVASQVVTTVPGAPTNLTATGGNASVSLTWTGSAGATSYNVKRGTVSGGPYTQVGTVTSTSYSDGGLTNGTTYYYVVTAANSVGVSGNSNEANATPTAPAPDYSMSTTPSSQTVTQGNGTSYTTTVSALNGYTGTVSLSVSGLPSGASGSFSPSSIATSGSSTLSVTTATSTSAGTYPLTITGTDGTITHANSVTLVVNAIVQADFTLSVSPTSRSVRRGRSTTYTTTIAATGGFAGTVSFSVSGLPSGTTGTFSPTSVNGSGSSTLTVSPGSNATRGTFTLTVKGTSGTRVHSQNVSLTVQ